MGELQHMRYLTCPSVALYAVFDLGCLVVLAGEARCEHVIELDQPVAHAEEGLLLGNGDLSVSVYQAGEKIIWRLGKGESGTVGWT